MSVCQAQPLLNRRIVIGISGGIAAYKIPELVRRLKDWGADVRCVMTQRPSLYYPANVTSGLWQPSPSRFTRSDSGSRNGTYRIGQMGRFSGHCTG
jgi:phosphopantothenoylcysteine synthetase/decarboxylase